MMHMEMIAHNSFAHRNDMATTETDQVILMPHRNIFFSSTL